MSDDMHGQILKLKAEAFDAIKNDINNMRHGNIDFDQAVNGIFYSVGFFDAKIDSLTKGDQ